MSATATLLAQLSAVTLATLGNFVVLALLFTLATHCCKACNQTLPWWRKADLSTDLCWTFLLNLPYRFVRIALLFIGITLCYGITQPEEMMRFLTEAHGPFHGLGFWSQVVIYLLGSDLILYATHRMFHGVRLWRFHAVHHSSRHLEWVSAVRFHPVDAILHGTVPDVMMLLLGVSPEVLVWTTPFTVGTGALVHANLDWRFGPFRYVLASPVFHRWHHTSESRGGSSNFAATFPFIDLAFGTFYLPADQLPDAYGTDDPAIPADFAGQLVHPLLPRRQRVPRMAQSPLGPQPLVEERHH